MWHVSKIQIILIKSSLLCFTESQKVPFSAKFTVVGGGKMAPPPGGAPILQTCIKVKVKVPVA